MVFLLVAAVVVAIASSHKTATSKPSGNGVPVAENANGELLDANGNVVGNVSTEATPLPRSGTIPNDISSSGNNGAIGGDPNSLGQSMVNGDTYSHTLSIMQDYPSKSYPGYTPPGTAESAGGDNISGGPPYIQSQRLTNAAKG